MIDPRIAPLAEAIRRVEQTKADRLGVVGPAYTGPPSEWYDGYAAAILAALDSAGWRLHARDKMCPHEAELATLRAALDGLVEPLGEWLVEMMERNLTTAEANLYDALRAEWSRREAHSQGRRPRPDRGEATMTTNWAHNLAVKIGLKFGLDYEQAKQLEGELAPAIAAIAREAWLQGHDEAVRLQAEYDEALPVPDEDSRPGDWVAHVPPDE